MATEKGMIGENLFSASTSTGSEDWPLPRDRGLLMDVPGHENKAVLTRGKEAMGVVNEGRKDSGTDISIGRARGESVGDVNGHARWKGMGC